MLFLAVLGAQLLLMAGNWHQESEPSGPRVRTALPMLYIDDSLHIPPAKLM